MKANDEENAVDEWSKKKGANLDSFSSPQRRRFWTSNSSRPKTGRGTVDSNSISRSCLRLMTKLGKRSRFEKNLVPLPTIPFSRPLTGDDNLSSAAAEAHHGEVFEHLATDGAGADDEPPLALDQRLRVLSENGDLPIE